MEPQASRKIQRRRFQGVVVSNKMEKTLVVRVDRRKQHPKYQKYFVVSKKYKVHDPTGGYAPGDQVEFEECRPISRDKHWRVVGKLKD